MKKNLKVLNTVAFSETMYPYFWGTIVFIELITIIGTSFNNEDLLTTVLTSFIVTSPIFWLIWRLIFNKKTKLYNCQKKIYSHGKDLKIEEISYNAENSTENFNINII